MATIGVIGLKGGTGKSTTAIAIASELVARGDRVLLVDADPQATARTWGAVAAEQGHKAPTLVAMGVELARPGQLDQLISRFDHVVIDTPPRIGEITRSVLMVCDLALLPSGPSPADFWALASSVALVREAELVRPGLLSAVVLTRRNRTAVGASAREVIRQTGIPVLAAELGLRVAYVEALAAGQGVAAYAPNTPAALEVAALVDEVLALTEEDPCVQESPRAVHALSPATRQRRRGRALHPAGERDVGA